MYPSTTRTYNISLENYRAVKEDDCHELHIKDNVVGDMILYYKKQEGIIDTFTKETCDRRVVVKTLQKNTSDL